MIAKKVLPGDADAVEKAATGHLDFVEKSFRIGMQQAKSETIARKRAAILGQ